MSIRLYYIYTNYKNMEITFITEDRFLTYNPWFNQTIRQRIRQELNSSLFTHKVREEARYEIERQFPSLWRSYMYSDPAFLQLKSRLDDHVNNSLVRVNQNAENGINLFTTTLNNRINELVNDSSFESLKSNIYNTAISNYKTHETTIINSNRLLQDEFKTTFNAAEDSRNKRLNTVEGKMNDIKNNQVLTFLGGAFVGCSMVLVANILGKK